MEELKRKTVINIFILVCNRRSGFQMNQPTRCSNFSTALLSPSSDGKPEADTAVVELLMMGMRMPETC
jgi:hypothetical protein